jgi:hypothetical protein
MWFWGYVSVPKALPEYESIRAFSMSWKTAQCRPHGTTRQLLAVICKLVEDFTELPATSASLVGRFVLCSWLVEAVQVAPALVLVGPDLMRANQLVTLLHCLCRRGLPMTGLIPAGPRALPSMTTSSSTRIRTKLATF